MIMGPSLHDDLDETPTKQKKKARKEGSSTDRSSSDHTASESSEDELLAIRQPK